MTGSTYNNGVSESRSYNTDNTLASISYTGASIGTYSYGWDDNKNKTSESITGTMSGYGFSVGTSGYDSEDRLVNWDRSDTNLSQSWDLSLVGDWDSITENGTAQNRTHGATHELLTAGGQSVTHDTKGNMTLIPAALRPSATSLALNWDFDNRLSTADIGNDSTVDVTYKWDALGRRVFRDDGTTAIVYVQSGQQTIADYVAGTAASSPKYRYVYASYIDEPVLRYEPAASQSRYYHRNQQYSIIALTDGVGAIQERYAYSAYGELTVLDGSGTVQSGSDNRYTYTGREWDSELELYHYRARMYDPVAGRFWAVIRLGMLTGCPCTRSYLEARCRVAIPPDCTLSTMTGKELALVSGAEFATGLIRGSSFVPPEANSCDWRPLEVALTSELVEAFRVLTVDIVLTMISPVFPEGIPGAVAEEAAREILDVLTGAIHNCRSSN